MHSSPFGRLVWKEFRAQFSLWAALVCGALLLQSLVMLTSGGARAGSNALMVVGAITFVLTSCFAVACLALLFAGEVEEGTRDWLQQLPVRPATLIGAKLTFALAASVLFFVVSWGTGLSVAVIAGHSLSDLFRVEVTEYQRSIAGAFVWGLLFSLLFRRVLHVLLAAVVAEIVTVALTDNLIGPWLAAATNASGPQVVDRARYSAYLVVVGLILVVDLVLAWRWANAGDGAMVAAPRRVHRPAVFAADWRENTWLRLVAWSARRGSPDARETAVLLWREARAAVPFAAVWILLGLITTDLGPVLHGPGQLLYQSPFQALYLIATPVVCGLMTCLGDQRQQLFRFLSERGVSPSRIWWVKQAVWAGLAVLLCVLFVRWDSAAADRIRQGAQSTVSTAMTLLRLLHVPTELRELAYDRPQDTSLQIGFLWALGFSLFAAGQCASFWIRRAILAFGCLLIAAPILVFWHYGLVAMDVPFWIGSWPLTIALMAATLISATAWLHGRDSWKLRLTRLAAIALPVGAVATVAAAHRVFSVPTLTFPPDVAAAITTRERVTQSPDAGWSTLWNVVLRNFPMQQYASPLPVQYQGVAVDTRERLLALSEHLGTGSHGRLDPLVLSPDHPVSVSAIVAFLTQPGAPDLVARNLQVGASTLDEQWQALVAGMRITQYLAVESQSAPQLIECTRARGILLAEIRHWAQRPDQTIESLRRAFAYMTDADATRLQTHPMIINRQVYYADLLNHRGRKWTELNAPGAPLSFDPSTIGAAMPGFERERAERILNLITNEYMARRTSLQDAFSPQGENLRRWAASSLPTLPANIIGDLYPQNLSGRLIPGSIDGDLLPAAAKQAATAAVIALQLYRLEHGAFPPSLSEALPAQFVQLLIDPYSGGAFRYEAEGLFGDLYLPDGHIIPAGQPLLYTPGYGGRPLARANGDIVRDGLLRIPSGAYHLERQQFGRPGTGGLMQTLRPGVVMYLDLTTLENDLPPPSPPEPVSEEKNI